MTNNERTLHTILSTCLKPLYDCATDGAKCDQLQHRLDEIERLAEIRVYINATAKGE